MQNKRKFLEDFVINIDDFRYLKNLYKFVPVREDWSFKDKKHDKTVAFISKNLFSGEDEIHFNLNWLAYEIIVTRSKKLIDIFSKYVENNNKYKQVKLILDKMDENDKQYIQSLSERRYNPTKDDLEHYKLSQYETLITTLQELL